MCAKLKTSQEGISLCPVPKVKEVKQQRGTVVLHLYGVPQVLLNETE